MERGRLEVDGHCLVLHRVDDMVEIPPAAFAALLMEPGTSATHESLRLCAENRTAVLWVGEGCTRIYAVGLSAQDPARVLAQARLQLDLPSRIAAARRLYALMFGDEPPPSNSLEKLRGVEGARIRAWYRAECLRLALVWDTRQSRSPLQSVISFSSGCLNAVAEVAVHLLGYAPSLGVVHSGDPRSFVFDLADTVKFRRVLGPMLEWHAATELHDYASVRRQCRDHFRQTRLLDELIENAEHVVYGDDRRAPFLPDSSNPGRPPERTA